MNQISVTTKPSCDGKKKWLYFEWGKAPDQRRAAGIFTYSLGFTFKERGEFAQLNGLEREILPIKQVW